MYQLTCHHYPATEDNIQQIIDAAGQQPVVPSATLTPTADSESVPPNGVGQAADVSSILELCLVSFLPLAMGIIVVRRRINA